MKDLSIIIVSFNTADLTIECIKSIKNSKTKLDYDIWLVDNASSDNTVEEVRKNFKDINIIESPENLGFSRGNNLALEKANSQYCLLLNSDTIVKEGAIDTLVQFAKSEKFDVCTCKLINKDGSFQANAGELPKLIPMFMWLSGLDDILGKFIKVPSYQERSAEFFKDGKEVGWISGAAMLINQKVLKEVGLLDSKIFMYGEDVDYCWRAHNNGFKVGWTNQAVITHISGASSKDQRLFKQWRGEFKGLLYLYRKYYGILGVILLRFLIYIFIALRMLAFLLIGKSNNTKIYGKIITTI